MNYEKIVTLYDTTEHAEAARRNLEAAGFPPSEISMVTSKTLGAGDRLREPSLWHRLFGRDIAQHEAIVYGRTVESGGSILTVRVPEVDLAKAMGILNAHRAVDVRERAVREGLLPATEATRTTTIRETPATMAAGSAIAGEVTTGEEVLRLAEEQLKVGKRLVREGTTRIRRFVTERPVEQQVTLHEEHAEVLRRAIAEGTAGDIDWSERTIEVTETAEEPVVTKDARVVEEVAVRKEGSDRVRTVKDKVRRQDVEVERVSGTGTVTREGTAKKA